MRSDAKWEAARKMGRFKYSTIQGFSFAILLSLILFAWNAFDGKAFSWQETAFMMFWNFVGMSIMQYLLLWPLNERHYKNRKQSRL
jgi:hypothetical protein